jgi:EipB-like
MRYISSSVASMRTISSVALMCAVSSSAVLAAANSGPIVMVPHRAVYDLILGDTRSGSQVTEVQGRMVFEITGSACEGYTQNMRFVTKMASAEGQPSVTDLRSVTFEDGNATAFRFNSSQLRDQKPNEAAVGDAKRADRDSDLAVELTKPEKKKLVLGNKVYLPVQHSIALVEAGRTGQMRLKADLYDGSEQGDKVYETTSSIGAEILPGGNKKLPEVKNAEPLNTLSAWPVSISYYEKGSDTKDAAPSYEMGFLFYENGVSRKLVIDYGDFSIKGDLKEITFLDPSPAAKCTPTKQ